MTEPELSNGISPEMGVVPVTEQSVPLFAPTVKQGEILEQMTLSYVKNNKLPFTTVGLDIGRQIITDAVQKGMMLGGLVGVDETVNIRTVVKEGLAQRGKITQEAQRICRQYDSAVQTAGDRFIGSYALPTSEIIRASHEVNHAVATPVLAHSEGLVAKEITRAVLLPQMARAILGSLSQEQFPDVTLDLFPDVDSQSKLVRNAITSMNYRGNPLPQLQIDEVVDFSSQDKKLDPTILAPLVHFIAESSGQDPNEIAEFLRDLGLQTDDFFKKAKGLFTAHGVLGKNDTKARDFVYRYFDKRLLLLHPALEEKELIMDYNLHVDGEYSLWDPKFSTIVEGNRIPESEILQRALRLSIARGRNGTRYKEALDAWRKFERAEGNNQDRITTLEGYLQKIEVEMAQASPENMPYSEVHNALSTNVWKAQEYKYTKRKYDEDVRMIDRGESIRLRLEELETELRRENGGELPQKTVLSSDLIFESTHRRRLNAAKATVARNEYQATDTFSNDFFNLNIPKEVKESQFNFLVMDTATLESMKARLTIQLNSTMNVAGDIIPAEIELRDVRRHIDETIGALADSYIYLQGTDTNGYEKPFTLHERQRYEEYRNLKESLGPMLSRLPSTKGVPKAFYNYSLSSRIAALNGIVEARKRLEMVESKDIALRTVTKEEFEQSVSLAKIQAPIIDGQNAEVHDMSDVMAHSAVTSIMVDLSHFPIPKVVSGKEELLDWATTMLSELPDKPLTYPRNVNMATTDSMIYRRRRQLASLNNLIDLLNSPLFPPDQLIKGLKTRALMSAMSFRYGYLHAKVSLDSDRQKFEEKKSVIDKIAYSNYLLHLNQRKNGYTRELEEVKARDPNRELVYNMELLKLAVPEESEV